MCTLTTAAASAFIGTSALDTYLNLKNSDLAHDEAKFAARRSREEAAARRLIAAENAASSEREAAEAERGGRLAAGELTALYGASGLAADVGTPATLAAQLKAQGAYDAEVIRRRSELESFLTDFEAGRVAETASFSDRRASGITDSAMLDFATDVLRLGGSGYSLLERGLR